MRSHFLDDKVTNGHTFELCQGRIGNENRRQKRSDVHLKQVEHPGFQISISDNLQLSGVLPQVLDCCRLAGRLGLYVL